MNYHRAFGLTLASEIKISRLPDSVPVKEPDIVVSWKGNQPNCREPENLVYSSFSVDGSFSIHFWRLAQDDFLYRFDAPGVYLEFLLLDNGSQIQVSWDGVNSTEDLMPPFIGPVMGALLRLRGTVCIHASAVQFDGGSLLLVGSKGAGKSTTAAALLKRGGRLVTDDIAALKIQDGNGFIQPGTVAQSLWADSAFKLLGFRTIKMPRMYRSGPYRPNKRICNLAKDQVVPPGGALPVKAAYFLCPRRKDQSAASIHAMKGSTALATLARNAYAQYAVQLTQKPLEFELLAQFSAAVPAREVERPDNLSQIQVIAQMIHSDFESLTEFVSERQN